MSASASRIAHPIPIVESSVGAAQGCFAIARAQPDESDSPRVWTKSIASDEHWVGASGGRWTVDARAHPFRISGWEGAARATVHWDGRAGNSEY